MTSKQRKIKNSMETLLEAANLYPELVKSDVYDKHNTGGYSATVANISFGILRTPKGSKIFSPDAYFSLESKVRVAVEEIIENGPKSCIEIHDELKRRLPTLPENKHERQLIKMYEAASMPLTHSILTDFIAKNKVKQEEVEGKYIYSKKADGF